MVVVDPIRIREVLTNLLNNAVAALAGGGLIRLVLSHEDGHAVVRVIDDGPGIPRSLQVKVFDLFVSGKKASRTSGAGVGLHLVKRNV